MLREGLLLHPWDSQEHIPKAQGSAVGTVGWGCGDQTGSWACVTYSGALSQVSHSWQPFPGYPPSAWLPVKLVQTLGVTSLE